MVIINLYKVFVNKNVIQCFVVSSVGTPSNSGCTKKVYTKDLSKFLQIADCIL